MCGNACRLDANCEREYELLEAAPEDDGLEAGPLASFLEGCLLVLDWAARIAFIGWRAGLWRERLAGEAV